MVIVKPIIHENTDIEIREGLVHIAMEFKWSDMKYKTEFQKNITNDLTNLSKMMLEGSYDHRYKPEAKIIRINKGNKPKYAYMFIVDVTEEKEKISGANKLYKQLEKDFPEIKIIWAFPNEEKD